MTVCPVLAINLQLLDAFQRLSCTIFTLSTSAYIPFIEGIPEVPGALLGTGHLLALGEDHATTFANSFDDAKRISTQSFTIGSNPWDESCKNKCKASGDALGRAKIEHYFDTFDLESYCIVRDVAMDSKNGSVEISLRPYIQRYALNTTLTLCYGIRMVSVYDSILRKILHVGSAISLPRSASENSQDYIPTLRYWLNDEKNKRSRELRDRRDTYLNALLDQVREMIRQGTDNPCISAALLKDKETRLTGVEVSNICLSLVSGGLETIPGTLTSCIGSLSTPPDHAAEKASAGLEHFAFGVGSRACSGQIIAGLLLYTALMRIICSYQIVANEIKPLNTDYVEYNNFKTTLVAIPRDFDVRLIPRDGMQGASEEGTLDACLEEARARTAGYYKEESRVKI
ncbi:hypothetical protein QTJ16_000692 [Diplocarpon rosae]|uniref:Cytochrome P450 n=1 Tax=Diplocarpon rosae TaxID=946125 RepID=A0AAD9T6V2_9HELO|nr:hypothetical protein QTJ16_000692 [Diplocarpon rosae]